MYKENSESVVKDNNGIRDFVIGNFIQSCQIVSINITQIIVVLHLILNYQNKNFRSKDKICTAQNVPVFS